MQRELIDLAVSGIRLAINNGAPNLLQAELFEPCLFDALQIVVAACEDSIAGQPGRISNFLYRTQDEDLDVARHELIAERENNQEAERVQKKLVLVSAEPNGYSKDVAIALERWRGLQDGDRGVIAIVAQLCSSSETCRKLFKSHLRFILDNDAISTLA